MPTKQLDLHGSWKAKTRSGEPVPRGDDSSFPAMPDYIAAIAYASECWDYHMPKLSGIEAIRQIKRREAGLEAPPGAMVPGQPVV